MASEQEIRPRYVLAIFHAALIVFSATSVLCSIALFVSRVQNGCLEPPSSKLLYLNMFIVIFCGGCILNRDESMDRENIQL